jgi:hypothetical protein
VRVFHFYGTGSQEELPSQAEARRRFAAWMRRPKERHHIFPQAFESHFKFKGINIHQWTLLMDAAEHAKVHRLKDRGPWNTEWAAWITLKGKQATKAMHFEFASYLLQKYNLWGLPVTYWQTFTLPPLPPSP